VSRITRPRRADAETEGVMKWFARQLPYDRDRILQEAARAKGAGKTQRAIDLYRRVLAVEPANPDLHAKIAPLLAATQQGFEAWVSYRTAARAFVSQGELERGRALFAEATKWLPREPETWVELANLLRQQGDGREAKQVLLEGSRYFTAPYLRPCGIYLLRRAREIDPSDLDVQLELAVLLARAKQRDEARALVANAEGRAGGPDLLRLRAARLRVAPSLWSAWLWYRALRNREPEPPDPDEQNGDVIELRVVQRERR
jgi:thioredoxin-like negative regulator of GroEL